MTARERRQHPRISFETDLIVHSQRSGTLPGTSIDVSELGMAALLSGELKPGERVELRFKVGSEKLNVRAFVRYKNVFRYGLQFLQPLHDFRRDTKAICQRCNGTGYVTNQIPATPVAFIKIKCPICGGHR